MKRELLVLIVIVNVLIIGCNTQKSAKLENLDQKEETDITKEVVVKEGQDIHREEQACGKIVNELKGKEPPIKVSLEYLKNEKSKIESVLALKSLLKDFGVSDEEIIKNCEEATRRDNVDWAICTHIEAVHGDTEKDFKRGVPQVFHRILCNAKGFIRDWKYSDKEIQLTLNGANLLGKHNLSISFTEHTWNQSFNIALTNTRTQKIYEVETFSYTNTSDHNMNELIKSINGLLENEGLILLDADSGGDEYTFILLTIPEYDRLKNRYEPLNLWITYKLGKEVY